MIAIRCYDDTEVVNYTVIVKSACILNFAKDVFKFRMYAAKMFEFMQNLICMIDPLKKLGCFAKYIL